MKTNPAQKFFVYILLCENNSYYTGYTNNLEKRWASHVNGSGGCKYTKSFKPVKIVQAWEIHGSKSDAMKLEASIKKLSRLQKDNLIKNPSALAISNQIKVGNYQPIK